MRLPPFVGQRERMNMDGLCERMSMGGLRERMNMDAHGVAQGPAPPPRTSSRPLRGAGWGRMQGPAQTVGDSCDEVQPERKGMHVQQGVGGHRALVVVRLGS